jgi:hypothetical protein
MASTVHAVAEAHTCILFHARVVTNWHVGHTEVCLLLQFCSEERDQRLVSVNELALVSHHVR